MVGLGLIGCGAWGVNYLKTLLSIPTAEILYICDLNKDVLNKISCLYPALQVTTDYHDLLNDENVRGVIIAAPPKDHFQIAADFLLHKKAVLVEKPVTLSLCNAEILVKLAKENNTILMAGHLMEYHPAIEKLQNYIRQGIFGDLRYILLDRGSMSNRQIDISVLWNLAVHDLSIIRFLVDRKPQWVSAQGANYRRQDVHDLVTITLGFSDCLFVQIHANRIYPIKNRQIVIAGEKMSAILQDTREDFKLQLIPDNSDMILPIIEKILPLTRQCQHYIECIQKDSKPRTGLDDILWIMEAAALAEQSLICNGERLYCK